MEFKTKITRIGNNALNNDDQLLVLFGDSVTSEIAEVSLSQKFEDADLQSQFTLKSGDQVFIGKRSYKVKYAGNMIEENMRTMGHINLIFGKSSNDVLSSAVYLDGNLVLDDIKVGTVITYHSV